MRFPAALVAALIVAGSCSGGSGEGAASADEQRRRSASSSPFTIDETLLPSGFELVVAGKGTTAGDWGEDSTGTVEPYSVYAPGGRLTDDGVVQIALTGFEGYQGGLAQASLGYLSGHAPLVIDGAQAIYAPPSRDARGQRWADLVVVRGEDLAVRLSSPTATEEELVALARRVEVPEDRSAPPTLADPGAALQHVGSASVEGVLAIRPFIAPHTDRVPGPRSAHSAGWFSASPAGSGQGAGIAVLTVPGSALDIDAVRITPVAWPDEERSFRTIDAAGRPGLLVDERSGDRPESNRRTVLVDAPWGDVVVVSASGVDIASHDALVDLAASVQQADETTWAQFVASANGGPGLRADLGRHELARGRIGEIEWLLQDGPPGGGPGGQSEGADTDLRGVDPCLKLADGRRACTTSGSATRVGGGNESDWYGWASDPDGLSFVVVATHAGPGVLRVTTATGSGTAELVEVPAGRLWGAVVFVSGPSFASCMPSAEPLAPGQMRIERLFGDRRADTECLFGEG